jgi:hypothetical protein
MNHVFRAAELRLARFWAGCTKSQEISASGTWQFLSPEGATSQGFGGAYLKGSLVYLTFNNSPTECLGGIGLTSWNVGGASGLCLQMDPDTPCDGYIFDKH